MRTITKYQANDGSIWETKEEAVKADLLAAEIAVIMSILPKKPKSSSERIHVDASTAEEAWENFIKICKREFPGEAVFKHAASEMGYAGRFLSEQPFSCLRDAWHWFACYNQTWLYEQPFFAINPHKFIPGL